MNLTKSAIAQSICIECGYCKSRSSELLELMLEMIKQSLISGEDVLISGFGKFCVKEKNKRRGKSPAPGNDMTLGAKRAVTFRCSAVMREKLNGKGRD